MTSPSLSRCTLALLLLIGVAGGPGRALAKSPPVEQPASPPLGVPAGRGPSSSANLVMLPTIAAAIGPSWSLDPAAKTSLVVDVTVGAVIGWPVPRSANTPKGAPEIPIDNTERYLHGTLWLQPELGYSYQHGDDSDPRTRGHLGSLGLGLGYGNLLFSSVAYTPRLVVGALGEELAVGLRHGLAGHFLGRLFSVELAHQMLWTGDNLRHELRLVFGLNAGALLVSWL